jgi:hypothetical protein
LKNQSGSAPASGFVLPDQTASSSSPFRGLDRFPAQLSHVRFGTAPGQSPEK